mgnify:FL=1
MIEVNGTNVKALGMYGTIVKEFATLVHGLKDSGIRKKDLREAFNVGLMSDQEIDAAIKEKKAKAAEKTGEDEDLDELLEKLAEKIEEKILEDAENEKEAPDR